MRREAWPALLSLAGLAACAPAAPPAPPAPPPEPIVLDGTYVGIARLVRAETRGCPRSGRRTVTVTGGVLTINYRPDPRSGQIPLSANADAAGAIHGSDGVANLDGQITGQHMDLTLTTPACDLRYALERR